MARFGFILGVVAAVWVAPTCLAQRNRVFGFNSTQQASRFQPYNPHGQKKPSSFGYQVSVIGNFGATFTVRGMGTSNSGRQDEFVDIVTNQPLSFQATSFTTLMLGGSSASAAGSITYEMELYAGTSMSVGAPITSAVSGTDSGFNGAQVVLSGASIPGNGQVVLRLSRTLSLTERAEGATIYTASGTIVLTIN